jgi:hypothetical protein
MVTTHLEALCNTYGPKLKTNNIVGTTGDYGFNWDENVLKMGPDQTTHKLFIYKPTGIENMIRVLLSGI